jgi:hypothetical protein
MKTKARQSTTGFGCPVGPDAHHFVVSIPRSRTGDVLITERYGIGEEHIERCLLPAIIWAALAETVQAEFNQRLRKESLSTGRWRVGANKVERLLGKELLVLAWALEQQTDASVVPTALRNWQGLKPEERWWLTTMTAAATGKREDAGKGWRKALYYILAENPVD